MIQKLQRRFALSRQGAIDLIKGCLACVLQDLSFMFPVGLLYQFVLDMMAGGVIVGIFGVKLFMTNPVKQIRRPKYGNRHYWQDFFSTLLMTISNPGAFFLMLGLFAFIGISRSEAEPLERIAVTLAGVFTGAVLWWHILSTSINLFRNKLRLRQLIMINRIAGVVIMVLGLISLFEGLYRIIILP